jgi:hypothetical protein
MSAFVGRVDELAALSEIAGAAERGHAAAAVILGDPGSGKSRLLAEAAAQAQLSDRFRVVGYEPEREVPLASASDLLRALAEVTPQGRRLQALVFDAGREEASPLKPLRIQALPVERLRRLELGPLGGDEALELVKTLAPALRDDAARKLAEQVRRARAGSDVPFDLVVEAPPGADVHAWEAAGATWVRTSIDPQPPQPEVRAVVDAGP